MCAFSLENAGEHFKPIIIGTEKFDAPEICYIHPEFFVKV